MRWVRLLVVWAVVSLFAGAFRDASLHPSDVASVVGARAVAALHVRASSELRAGDVRVARPRATWSPALVATEHAPPRRDIDPRPTPWLVRQLFAEHAALLC